MTEINIAVYAARLMCKGISPIDEASSQEILQYLHTNFSVLAPYIIAAFNIAYPIHVEWFSIPKADCTLYLMAIDELFRYAQIPTLIFNLN